jgi:hypothetical protein
MSSSLQLWDAKTCLPTRAIELRRPSDRAQPNNSMSFNSDFTRGVLGGGGGELYFIDTREEPAVVVQAPDHGDDTVSEVVWTDRGVVEVARSALCSRSPPSVGAFSPGSPVGPRDPEGCGGHAV